MWVMVPMPQVIKSFFMTIPDDPFQAERGVSAAGRSTTTRLSHDNPLRLVYGIGILRRN
jgi:hypothetical protein